MEDRKVGLSEGLASLDLTYSLYPNNWWHNFWAFLVSRCFLSQCFSLDILRAPVVFQEKIASLQSSATSGKRCPFQSTASMEPSAAMGLKEVHVIRKVCDKTNRTSVESACFKVTFGLIEALFDFVPP